MGCYWLGTISDKGRSTPAVVVRRDEGLSYGMIVITVAALPCWASAF